MNDGDNSPSTCTLAPKVNAILCGANIKPYGGCFFSRLKEGTCCKWQNDVHTQKNIALYTNKLYDSKPTVQTLIILSFSLIVCGLF